MRKQCYQTALGNCYGLKLPKCWLQFKKKILCHLLYFSAHCRYLLQWMQPRLSRYANNLQLRCLNAGATGILEWLCTERRLCSSICFRNLKCSTRMLSEKRWKNRLSYVQWTNVSELHDVWILDSVVSFVSDSEVTICARVLIRTCWGLQQRLVATWAEFQYKLQQV